MPATKLKAIFKSIFGFSVLQYHKEKNLLFARQLVQRSPVQIKKVAAIAGIKQ
ncbi:helix-turn-helix transcriptional regulator [Niastella koreensis]|uniref:helix-turn-helix transcriptional regulator n=1 Tax=Niastella koreensis TaxID=354356 RepID=UPI0002FDA4B7|nr:helix-turn-helix transcriptional regulator [Niastella koreensis]